MCWRNTQSKFLSKTLRSQRAKDRGSWGNPGVTLGLGLGVAWCGGWEWGLPEGDLVGRQACCKASCWKQGLEDKTLEGAPSRVIPRFRSEAAVGVGQSYPVFAYSWMSAPRLPMEEQLEDLIGLHKDLWEFHVSHYHCLCWSPSAPGSSISAAQAQCQGVVLDSSLPVTGSAQPTQPPLTNPHCRTQPPLPRLLPWPLLTSHPSCSPRVLILQWQMGTPIQTRPGHPFVQPASLDVSSGTPEGPSLCGPQAVRGTGRHAQSLKQENKSIDPVMPVGKSSVSRCHLNPDTH